MVAKTGWTTDELSTKIDEETKEGNFISKYSLVTLLIGVNNQYRGPEKGYNQERYEQEFTSLLERALGFAGADWESKGFIDPRLGTNTLWQKSGRDLAWSLKRSTPIIPLHLIFALRRMYAS